jgi:phosphomevalonate kinase
MNSIEVYAFSGKMGSGKNFLAEKIFSKMLPQKETAILAFGDQLKIEGITKHGLDREKCFFKKDEYTRKALQDIGTEAREAVGKEVWISYLREWIELYKSRGVKRFIITDVRYENELRFLKDEFSAFIIRVEAPKRATYESLSNSAHSHASEVDLDNKTELFDYFIYNDPEDDASTQVRELVKKLKKQREDDVVIFCDMDDTLCECNIYYAECTMMVCDLLYSHIRSEIHFEYDNFKRIFRSYTEKNNGGYANSHFYLEKFADSLVKTCSEIFADMKSIFIDVMDENLIKNQAFVIGMDVFNKEYVEIENNISIAKSFSDYGRLVIFTMGDKLEQYRKISKLVLIDNEFEIYDFKDETLYRNLMAKYPAKKHIMIGDSTSRDIIPAVNAGVEEVIWYNRYRRDFPKEMPENVKTKIKVIYDLNDAKNFIQNQP